MFACYLVFSNLFQGDSLGFGDWTGLDSHLWGLEVLGCVLINTIHFTLKIIRHILLEYQTLFAWSHLSCSWAILIILLVAIQNLGNYTSGLQEVTVLSKTPKKRTNCLNNNCFSRSERFCLHVFYLSLLPIKIKSRVISSIKLDYQCNLSLK